MSEDIFTGNGEIPDSLKNVNHLEEELKNFLKRNNLGLVVSKSDYPIKDFIGRIKSQILWNVYNHLANDSLVPALLIDPDGNMSLNNLKCEVDPRSKKTILEAPKGSYVNKVICAKVLQKLNRCPEKLPVRFSITKEGSIIWYLGIIKKKDANKNFQSRHENFQSRHENFQSSHENVQSEDFNFLSKIEDLENKKSELQRQVAMAKTGISYIDEQIINF